MSALTSNSLPGTRGGASSSMLKRLARHQAPWLVCLSLVASTPASGQIAPVDQTTDILAFTPGHSGDTNLWGAIGDSMKLLMIEHGWRIAFQEETRRALAGPRSIPQHPDRAQHAVLELTRPRHGVQRVLQSPVRIRPAERSVHRQRR